MGLLRKAVEKKQNSAKGADRPPPRNEQKPRGEIPVPPEYKAASGLPGELKNEIIKYCNTFTSVHGIVLSYPKNYDEKKEGESFTGQLNRIIAALGTAVPLSPRYSLVLFSNTIDRELLAHRLSRSLETETPVVFQSDNVASVVGYIRPYL
ncbi:MAG: hypothetical protein LBU19_00415 [Treponema sp.]|jgi:hypothetical protein|nr:hypothetical protein [Treponema sp.]